MRKPLRLLALVLALALAFSCALAEPEDNGGELDNEVEQAETVPGDNEEPAPEDPEGPEVPGDDDPDDVPGSDDPAVIPGGDDDPSDVPGSDDVADVPGDNAPAVIPGIGTGVTDEAGDDTPTDVPGSDDAADVPGGSEPADLPEEGAGDDAGADEPGAPADPADTAATVVTVEDAEDTEEEEAEEPGPEVIPEAVDAAPEAAAETVPEAVPEAAAEEPVLSAAAAPAAEVPAEPAPTADSEEDCGVAGINSDAVGVAGVNAAYADEQSVRGFVYRMYTIVLGRDPEEGGFDFWVKQLEGGRCTAAQLVSEFFDSAEYKAKGKTNGQIVMDCYKAMLDREPDTGGQQYWMERLGVGMSPSAICAGFVSSKEFKNLTDKYGILPGTIYLKNARDLNYAWTSFIFRLYFDCLERKPETNGLEYWCNQLKNGKGGAEVAAGFVFSKEYKNRLPGNDTYVAMLYRTILGRTYETAGLEYWVDKLDYTNSREHVLNGFMHSQEFYNKCVKAGLKVGKDVAEPENTAAWRANILVLTLVNKERANYGLPGLKTREDLWERVAMTRATEVKTLHSHTRPNGSEWKTAYWDAGFDYAFAAENIAWGYRNEQSVVNAWMNSTMGHRENILDPRSEYLATGRYANQYWSQNFYTE